MNDNCTATIFFRSPKLPYSDSWVYFLYEYHELRYECSYINPLSLFRHIQMLVSQMKEYCIWVSLNRSCTWTLLVMGHFCNCSSAKGEPSSCAHKLARRRDSISSKDRPFVSNTFFLTNRAAAKHTIVKKV